MVMDPNWVRQAGGKRERERERLREEKALYSVAFESHQWHTF